MLATLQLGNINRGFDLPREVKAVRQVAVSSHLSRREVGTVRNAVHAGQNSSPMPTVQPRMLGPNR